MADRSVESTDRSLECADPSSVVGVFVCCVLCCVVLCGVVQSTAKVSDKELVRQMSKIGANVMCTSFRELSILSGEVLFDHVPTVLNSFGDILTQPAFIESELAEVRAQYLDMLE